MRRRRRSKKINNKVLENGKGVIGSDCKKREKGKRNVSMIIGEDNRMSASVLINILKYKSA